MMKMMYVGLALLAVSPAYAMDLLEADVKAVDADGNTVLYRELLKGEPNTDVIGSATGRGADCNHLNGKQEAALHIILANKALASNRGLLCRVLGNGAKPDEKAFALAQANGDSEAVKLMQSEKDMLVALSRHDGYAATEIIQRGGLHQDARFENGDTYLHKCLKMGVRFIPVVKELLWQGADLCALNAAGDNALHVALQNKPSEQLAELISHMIQWNRKAVDDKALALAAQNGHGELLSTEEKRERKRAAQLAQPEKYLFEAIDCCDEESALYILARAKINVNARSERVDTYDHRCKGDTLLHRCAWAGEYCANIIEALLAKGADTKAVNDIGETIVDKALSHSRALNSIGTRGENKEFKEPYFVEWLRLRMQYPTQPLRFIVDYDEYNRTTGEREQGQMCVTYFNPKPRRDTNCQFSKHEQRITCNGKRLIEVK